MGATLPTPGTWGHGLLKEENLRPGVAVVIARRDRESGDITTVEAMIAPTDLWVDDHIAVQLGETEPPWWFDRSLVVAGGWSPQSGGPFDQAAVWRVL